MRDDFWKNVKECMVKSICFPEDICNNETFEAKIISVDSEFYEYFVNLKNKADNNGKNVKVKLYKNTNDLNKVHRTMIKNQYEKDKIRAIVKTLGVNSSAFSYKKTLNLDEEEAKDLTATFNNDDGMVHHKFN